MNNDDIVRGGRGFSTHSHRDMEIVTWVLDGELAHRDSIGTDDVIYPGLAQRMSAGSGIQHSEMNASATADVHLVQMWVLPDTNGIAPSYEQRDLNDALGGGGLVPVASGQGHDGAVSIHQRDAVLFVGPARPGRRGGRARRPPRARVRRGRRRGPRRARRSRPATRCASPTRARRAMVAGAAGAEVLVWVTA